MRASIKVPIICGAAAALEDITISQSRVGSNAMIATA